MYDILLLFFDYENNLFDKIRKGSDLMLDIGMEGIYREYENL